MQTVQSVEQELADCKIHHALSDKADREFMPKAERAYRELTRITKWLGAECKKNNKKYGIDGGPVWPYGGWAGDIFDIVADAKDTVRRVINCFDDCGDSALKDDLAIIAKRFKDAKRH